MSYILDALNKSEQERREENSAPSLHAIHDQAEPPTPPASRAPWLVAGLVTVLAVVYLAIDHWPQQAAVPEPAAAPPQASTPATNNQEPAAEAATTGKPPLNNQIKGLYSAEAKAAAQKAQAAAEEEARAAKALQEQQKAADQQALARLLADEEARRIAEQITQGPERIQTLRELSSGLRQRLPAISYSAHIYSADENSGFVIMNGRKRYAGDIVAPELFIKRVRENDVVLNFRGTTFSLDAMRSWEPR